MIEMCGRAARVGGAPTRLRRAEGLAEEIGADLYAPDAAAAVRIAGANPNRRATVDQQTVGRTRPPPHSTFASTMMPVPVSLLEPAARVEPRGPLRRPLFGTGEVW